MNRKWIFAILLSIIIFSLGYVYWVWTSTPIIKLPNTINSTPTENIKITCASVSCSYYRHYEAQIDEAEAIRRFAKENWDCKQIRNNQDLGVFTLQMPYLQCSNAIFPRGQAIVAIYKSKSTSSMIDMMAYVYWDN